jgi:hypothetical protein
VAGGNAHRRLVEEYAALDAKGQVVDVQHGATP